MSFEEAEILKERAEAFLRNAKRLIEEKEWDLAMFSLEQYSQLILKYKLLVKYGTYPRTHSIRRGSGFMAFYYKFHPFILVPLHRIRVYISIRSVQGNPKHPTS